MKFIFQILDWFFFRYALPYARKRGFFKEPSMPLVVKYEEIMQQIHDDKVKNKPGVYFFISRNRRTGERKGGFILGKETTEDLKGTRRHVLALLHESDHIAVGRLHTTNEEVGQVISYLRSLGGRASQAKPHDWCKARDACASIFNEPEALHHSAALLFEHKGD